LEQLQHRYLAAKTSARSPIHSIHKWYGKLIPAIPRWAIQEYTKPGDNILDPFCGSGTTLVEAMLLRRHSVGADIDPLAYLISKVKTTRIDFRLTEKAIKGVLEFVKTKNSDLPPHTFPNVTYWFNPNVVVALTKLFNGIAKEKGDLRNFLLVCLSSIVRDVSRADPRFLITARSKHRKSISEKFTEDVVFKRFGDTANAYRKCIKLVPNAGEARPEICNSDSRFLEISNKVDLVVTNPPYVGATDYVRAMRLERYWLGLVRHDLELQRNEIGYSRAHQEGLFTNIPSIDAKLEAVKLKSTPAFNTLATYFADMKLCFNQVNKALKKGGRVVIKIGDIKLGRTDIGLGESLVAVGEPLSWKLEAMFPDTIGNRTLFTKRYEKTNPSKIEFDWIIVLQKE
jgi:adenine-specific DNA methylase